MNKLEFHPNGDLRLESGSASIVCQLLTAIQFSEDSVSFLTNMGLLHITGTTITITDQNYAVQIDCEDNLVEYIKKEITS